MIFRVIFPGGSGYFGIRSLHAPDGFFSIAVSSASWGLALAFVFAALRVTGRSLNERMVPALGVFAAFIFAAQIFNFPIAGGTSAHLLGAALASIVLGLWAAVVIMTAVVIMQALMFQDGGLVVMGANLLNIAIFPTVVAYLAFTSARALVKSQTGILVLAGIAAWFSVEAGALGVAIGLSLSGTSPFFVTAPVMLGVNALVGICEGVVTAGAIALVLNAKRELLTIGRVLPETIER